MAHSINNIYFIVPVADIDNYITYIEEDSADLRKNIAGTEYVIKLPFNQVNIPDPFAGLLQYNHATIMVEMVKTTWSEEI